MHHDAVRLAYGAWPDDDLHTWQGLSVYAIDGSKYNLPASAALRAAFDPDSGLDKPGKGHCPQRLVSTACGVFRRSKKPINKWQVDKARRMADA